MYFKLSGLILLVAVVALVKSDVSENSLIDMVNRIDSEKSLYLFGGLTVEKSKNARSLSAFDSEDFVERASRYLESHELKFSYDNVDSGRALEEARTGKLKKLALPLLLALKIKMGLILPIVLKALTLVSLKGLIAGTMALLLSGAMLLKDLFQKKREQVTTAYITGPQPLTAEIIQQDWNRNGQVGAQELAYNYHTLPHTQQFA